MNIKEAVKSDSFLVMGWSPSINTLDITEITFSPLNILFGSRTVILKFDYPPIIKPRFLMGLWRGDLDLHQESSVLHTDVFTEITNSLPKNC